MPSISNFANIYFITTLSSAIIILIMAVCLFAFVIPRDTRLRKYRVARRLLAYAYIILAAVGFWEVFGNAESENHDSIQIAFTLIAASFQAFLFTFSLITLIDIHYVTHRKIIYNLFPMITGSGILLLSLFDVIPLSFNAVFYTSLSGYCIQLVFYTVLFLREYNKCRKQINNFFSDDEDKRLNWIKTAFFLALAIGIIALVSLFIPLRAYIVFTILYTAFYVYYAMKYINYVNLFHYIISALELPLVSEKRNGNDKNLDIIIHSWIAGKGFTAPEITLDTLASELSTNRTYLSSYINQNMNCNFKTWIGELRIEEAKRLMLSNQEISLSEIGEMVGFSERVSFYRQFVKATGKTPQEFRMGN